MDPLPNDHDQNVHRHDDDDYDDDRHDDGCDDDDLDRRLKVFYYDDDDVVVVGDFPINDRVVFLQLFRHQKLHLFLY